MKRKILLVTLLSAGLIAAGGTALAHKGGGWRGGEGPRMERMMERMAERLELDEEQRASIQAIIEQNRPAMQEHRRAMRENRQALHELMRGGTADEPTVRSLAEAQGDLTAEMIVERALMMQSIREVLTPEQQARAERMMERRMGRHHGRGWGGERD